MTLPDELVGALLHLNGEAERQLERALQESDQRFREVPEAVSECLLPPWGRLHFSSSLLLDMLCLTPLELRQAQGGSGSTFSVAVRVQETTPSSESIAPCRAAIFWLWKTTR